MLLLEMLAGYAMTSFRRWECGQMKRFNRGNW